MQITTYAFCEHTKKVGGQTKWEFERDYERNTWILVLTCMVCSKQNRVVLQARVLPEKPKKIRKSEESKEVVPCEFSREITEFDKELMGKMGVKV